jgi:hypothetical protein
MRKVSKGNVTIKVCGCRVVCQAISQHRHSHVWDNPLTLPRSLVRHPWWVLNACVYVALGYWRAAAVPVHVGTLLPRRTLLLFAVVVGVERSHLLVDVNRSTPSCIWWMQRTRPRSFLLLLACFWLAFRLAFRLAWNSSHRSAMW